MSKFKVGDIVQYTGSETPDLYGAIGQVISTPIGSSSALTNTNIPVQWWHILSGRYGGKYYGVLPKNIVLLTGKLDAPESRTLPESSGASPVSDTQTSSD